jgi:poly(3-hydroxybutyrate) depolymerase
MSVKQSIGKRLIAALLILSSGGIAFTTNAAENLPGYNADLSQTSISGLSSGAFMTTQLHTAYSSHFIGVGIIAGGPYYCSGTYQANITMENAMTTCMNPMSASVGPDSEILYQKAQEFAEEGLIDDVANLQDDKVYLFSGASDETVKQLVVNQTKKYYELAGVPKENIKYNRFINAGHAIITNNPDDVECSITKAPFINNCEFMQSHRILKHIYGELNPPTNRDELSGKIVKFNQYEFIDPERLKYSSMSKDAYVYIPAACETERCRVHIAFHGCEQGAKLLGDEYYTTTGYNEMADTNKMIILYPQAEPSDAIPYNPKGCWDFWGYSSADPDHLTFYTQNAVQMSAVMKMLERLGSSRSDSPPNPASCPPCPPCPR